MFDMSLNILNFYARVVLISEINKKMKLNFTINMKIGRMFDFV